MIKLDRGRVSVPGDWEERVAEKFSDRGSDYGAYRAKAAEFEELPVDSATRKKGFKSFGREVLPAREGETPDFLRLWGEAKDELVKMSYHKCSYCESAIGHRGEGQVEHFKPKSLFPSLAYEWDNYFLACGGCNRPKSNKWPREGGYFRPDRRDPAGEFRFAEDGKMTAAREGGDASRTVRDFRLNEAWLVQWRNVTIRVALEELEDIVRVEYPLDRERARGRARRVVQRQADPRLPYSAAVTQCLRRAWNAACPNVPI